MKSFVQVVLATFHNLPALVLVLQEERSVGQEQIPVESHAHAEQRGLVRQFQPSSILQLT